MPSTKTDGTLPPCLKATIYSNSEDNPFVAVRAEDERGPFYMMDYMASPPGIVEFIRTKADKVRGNHVHAHCQEIMSILSGTLDLYLMCDCEGKHVVTKTMSPGSTAQIFPGTAHAVKTLTDCEFTSVFTEGDPREDRERVELVEYV